jgi:flavodoxin I
VGIFFFWYDTGNTEAAKMIQKELGKKLVEVKDIAKSKFKEEIAEYSLILVWYPNLLNTVKRSVIG